MWESRVTASYRNGNACHKSKRLGVLTLVVCVLDAVPKCNAAPEGRMVTT